MVVLHKTIDTQFKVLDSLPNLKKDSWNQVLDYLIASSLNFKILIGVLFIFLLLNFLYKYGNILMQVSAAFRFVVHFLCWCFKCRFPLFLLYRFSSFLPFWYQNYQSILLLVGLLVTVFLWASKAFSVEFLRLFGDIQMLWGWGCFPFSILRGIC